MHKIGEYPLHPYLVCLYCLTKANADLRISTDFWFEMFGLLLLLFWTITFFLQFIFKFLMSSNINGSIALSLLLFINFFLYPIHKTINYILPIVDRVRYSFFILTALWLLMSLFLFFYKKKDFTPISRYLSILFLLLSFIDISKWVYDIHNNSKETLLKQLTISEDPKNYNIFLIVPDGYASNKNLVKYWHFDNNELIDSLEDKGFFIAKNSRSNYRYTTKSISSMLNLDYFESSVTEPFMDVKIADNLTMHFLASQEYRCSIFDADSHDYLFDPHSVKINIKNYLYQQSAIYFLATTAHIYLNFENIPVQHKEHNVFKRLRQVFESQKASVSLKQFAYCHSMLTHYPFKLPLNDSIKKLLNDNFSDDTNLSWIAGFDDKPRSIGTVGDSLLLNHYLLTLKQTNDSLLTILNDYWQDIKTNSIVIIMSDHGFRSLPGKAEDYKSETYSNFCAIYFPDQDYSTLTDTDTITPINVIRMSVNKAVGTKLLYLPDKTYLR